MEINKVFNEKVSIILLILFCMLSYNRLLARDYLNEPESSIEDLWLKTVGIMLDEPLWKKRDAYDTGHYLMIPLHTAFTLNDKEKIKKFKQFFLSFSKSYYRDKFNSIGNLNKLHFLYLVSQYLHLSKKNNFILNQKLINIVKEQLEKIWKEPAWQWGQKPFSKGINERINWKLNVEEVKYLFFRAITDEEFFSFAIAADLRIYEINRVPKRSWSPIISDILNKAFETIQSRMLFTETGGCLFEPGAWRDHRDYNYVGNAQILPDLPVKKISDISEDSSYSHFWPLWLTSLRGASINDQEKYEYYGKVIKALEKQFYEHVLVPPTASFAGLRLNNFMAIKNEIGKANF